MNSRNDPVTRRQSQPFGPNRLSAEEWLIYPMLNLVGNATAGVSDRNLNLIGVELLRLERDARNNTRIVIR